MHFCLTTNNGHKMYKSVITLSLLGIVSLLLSACSTQQVIGAGITVASIPVKTVETAAGVAGGVVGGTVGGLVAGGTGAKYGSMAGQRAAKKAVP